MTNKCTIISQIITLQMFQHYHVILRKRVISSLPSYTGISNATVGNIVCILIQGVPRVKVTTSGECSLC